MKWPYYEVTLTILSLEPLYIALNSSVVDLHPIYVGLEELVSCQLIQLVAVLIIASTTLQKNG